MAHAIEHGAAHLVLGLGGSATNDGGCGCAAALGARFLDQSGQSFVPVGGTLKDIWDIDLSCLQRKLHGCTITAMCDIENPMHGEQGAAYIYAPQKGATPELVQDLDRQLQHLDSVIGQTLGIRNLASQKGAGAAGAFGAGAIAFLGAKLRPGIQVALDLVGFDDHLHGADAVFTGEGRIDGQSLQGKVVIGVARRAKVQQVPVYALVGDVGAGIEAAYQEGVTAIFSINQVAVPFSVARLRSAMDYRATLDNLLRLMRSVDKG
jgi:glycerate kinase